ncbi:MAG: alpha/beta hydrolase, partial [Eubacteriales bacterium]|nr:alpha/beta hydrolase [Eubacteriales bacterium]
MTNVFLHGLGQNASSWDPIIESDPETLAIKLYDYLTSDKPAYEAIKTGFFDRLDRLEAPFNLCGLSLGGILALSYALRSPQGIEKLVLLATPIAIPHWIML